MQSEHTNLVAMLSLFIPLHLCAALALGPDSRPMCLQTQFSQKKLLFGSLERLSGNKGALTFKKNVDMKKLSINLRMHPRIVPGADPYDVLTASSLSLAWTLDALSVQQRALTTVNVFLNTRNETDFGALVQWVEFLFFNRTAFAIYKCQPGNMESYHCMMRTLVEQSNDPEAHGLNANTIVYLVEDDYLHRNEATQELIDIFSSHNPCFALPYDYPDRYYMPDFNDDDGRITIIAGKNRHWRTVTSTTVTLAGLLETVLYFYRAKILPHPLDDYSNSVKMHQAGASIVSPLPGLAAHVEKYDNYRSFRTEFDDSSEYVSLYFNWLDFGKFLVQFAKTELPISMWTILEMQARDIKENSINQQVIN